jgi:hypothetical protein
LVKVDLSEESIGKLLEPVVAGLDCLLTDTSHVRMQLALTPIVSCGFLGAGGFASACRFEQGRCGRSVERWIIAWR